MFEQIIKVILPILSLLFAIPLGHAAKPDGGQAERLPNVLFITSDDLGLQLSCCDDTKSTTPLWSLPGTTKSHAEFADDQNRRFLSS